VDFFRAKDLVEIPTASENWSSELSYDVACVILRLAVLVELRLVTDGRTFREDHSIHRASIASRGKTRARSVDKSTVRTLTVAVYLVKLVERPCVAVRIRHVVLE